MNKNLLQVTSPYLPGWEYTPDVEPYVFNDRVYIYGSHDKYNQEVYCENDYVTWSAPVTDLGNWRYEGVIYRKDQDPSNKDMQGNLFASAVSMGPDGRYYLYYSLSNLSHVAVAVCDRPDGQFEFYGYVHYSDGTKLGERPTDEHQFDPAVLLEGDKVYLYTGFNPEDDKDRHGPMVTVLDKDMLTVIEDPEFIAPSAYYSKGTPYEGHGFFEASSIRVVNGKYYFIYSSYVNHELCYAVGDSPKGPFEYGGVIISNADIGIDTYKAANKPALPHANNHGSIIEINGEWYIFYHRHTNNHNYSRQACLEHITINADGSIDQVEMTSCGGLKPFVGEGVYPAYLACNLYNDEADDVNYKIPWVGFLNDHFPKLIQDYADVEPDGVDEIGYPKPSHEVNGYIYNMQNTATAGFKYFEFSGLKEIAISTKGYGSGKMELYVAKKGKLADRIKLGEYNIESTNVFTKASLPVTVEDGVYAVYLVFVGANNVSLKEIEFIK